MKNIWILTFLISFGLITACNNQTSEGVEVSENQLSDEELLQLAKTSFGELPVRAESESNSITDDKVLLGRVLYFDTRLSKNGNISCNSCHALDNYGVDNEPTSPGTDGVRGGRNSPTNFNAALHTMQFWDGRAADVEEQAGGPILNPVEHGIPDSAFLVDKLKGIFMYKELFANAFPDEEEAITYANVTRAIGSFERLLITPARIDDFIAGNMDALNEIEKEGLKNFVDAGCNTCHMGPAAGGGLLQKFGLFGDYWMETKCETVDEGRFEVTGVEADKYIFKVPSLRNVEKTFPYFHDGSVNDLNEVVRIMAKLQRDVELDNRQIESIVAFLKTFTGDIPDDLKTPPSGYLN